MDPVGHCPSAPQALPATHTRTHTAHTPHTPLLHLHTLLSSLHLGPPSLPALTRSHHQEKGMVTHLSLTTHLITKLIKTHTHTLLPRYSVSLFWCISILQSSGPGPCVCTSPSTSTPPSPSPGPGPRRSCSKWGRWSGLSGGDGGGWPGCGG